ncbi:MAG: hypothetical protein CME70_18245 [Halobacteriovorax sp.]|nr:hypothetical protein [Halobacteriovorax sp.]
MSPMNRFAGEKVDIYGNQSRIPAGGALLNYQQRERALGQQYLAGRNRAEYFNPWAGYTPDLPHKMIDCNSAIDIVGLISRPDTYSNGEVLTNTSGYVQQSNYRNIGSSSDETQLGHSDSICKITRLDLFESRTAAGAPTNDTSDSGMALTAGNGSTVGSGKLYKLVPNTNKWTEIDFRTTNTGSIAVFHTDSEMKATEAGDTTGTYPFKSMPDSCVFSSGAPIRKITDAESSPAAQNMFITEPVFIFTNNSDPVNVFPCLTGVYEYQPLTDKLGSGTAVTTAKADFRAVSVESFGDRVYFLNTYEATVRHPQRLRRTARGTADPDPANVGSGYIDLDQFAGAGLRVETLGNVLVCYFEDGVAFIRETGLATAPNSVQVLDNQKSLVGTHAVTRISDNEHFGIFDDGWWILDSNGRWREVGVAEAGGARFDKWKRTFYSLCDTHNEGYRVQTFFDEENRWVYITVPVDSSEITQVWIYDIDSDRVWVDSYTSDTANKQGVTVFGTAVSRDASAIAWSDVGDDTSWGTGSGGGTWDDDFPETPTWGSLAPAIGTHKMYHGNESGILFEHHCDIYTKAGEEPNWLYDAAQKSSRWLQTLDRLKIEYVTSPIGGNITVSAKAGKTLSGQSAAIATSEEDGDNFIHNILSTNNTFRVTNENLGFQIAGKVPIKIRGFYVDYLENNVERRG